MTSVLGGPMKLIFAAVIARIQAGFDNVPALHGETPVPQLEVTLHLRADAQAAQELRQMAGDGHVVHVIFAGIGAAVKRLEGVPLPMGEG